MLETRTVTLPHFTAGPDAYDAIAEVLPRYGRRVAVIGGRTALEKAGPLLLPALEKAGAEVLVVHVYGRDSTMANVERAESLEGVAGADVIVCVGGGRAIDTGKTVADRLGKPWFTCPTVASNCAPVSGVAVIYKDDGRLDHYHFCRGCPEHAFINTRVILDSPAELFWAGIGDALSKQIEVLLATRGKSLFHTTILGRALARACQPPLLELGAKALEDFRAKRHSEAFTECVLDIIVTTGIVSNLMTSREYYFNSSLAHCFYNASCVLPQMHRHLHGEVVSFGNLVLLAHDGQTELLEKFLAFNLEVGLPVTLAELDIDPEGDLDRIVEAAPSIKEWTCVPEPTTPERFREAVLAVDRAGRALKRI